MTDAEQTCALRALNLEDDQVDGCLALPCICDIEQERLEETQDRDWRPPLGGYRGR